MIFVNGHFYGLFSVFKDQGELPGVVCRMGGDPAQGFRFGFGAELPGGDDALPVGIRLLRQYGAEVLEGLLLIGQQFFQIRPLAGIFPVHERFGGHFQIFLAEDIFAGEQVHVGDVADE